MGIRCPNGTSSSPVLSNIYIDFVCPGTGRHVILCWISHSGRSGGFSILRAMRSDSTGKIQHSSTHGTKECIRQGLIYRRAPNALRGLDNYDYSRRPCVDWLYIASSNPKQHISWCFLRDTLGHYSCDSPWRSDGEQEIDIQFRRQLCDPCHNSSNTR